MYARAKSLRKRLTGTDYITKADTDLDPALVPVREVLTELVWGKVWLRPGIDRRTRSFMNIALFMALNRPQELAATVLREATIMRGGSTRASGCRGSHVSGPACADGSRPRGSPSRQPDAA